MVVGRSSLDSVLQTLNLYTKLAFDTETSGLRAYHGDRLFSIAIATEKEGYYFNFIPYEGLAQEYVLPTSALQELARIFAKPNIRWFAHNAKFDLAMLANEGIEVRGEVHCTKAIGRVEYNEHQDYDLDSSLKRIGKAKDDAVTKYIADHKLYEKRAVPGKKTQVTFKFYDRVPFDIIAPYGISDATGVFHLGLHQENSILEKTKNTPEGLPTLQNTLENERRLTTTIFRLERTGVLIDKEYCVRAARFEEDRALRAIDSFAKETGREYKASPKLFQIIFASERDKWQFTEKGNPSFDGDALKKFENPAAKYILEMRDAKAKSDFYNGFLYHADSKGRVHPNFNSDGTVHGRLSSSEPNFQNLSSEDVLNCLSCGKGLDEILSACPKCKSTNLQAPEFLIRRAIIPTPGYVFIMPDYDQMEYRFMLELACRITGYETPLVKLVKTGLDVHSATAQVASQEGVVINREAAKTSNFLTIYGGGNQKLADGLRCTLEQAKAIREAIFKAAPEIKMLIRAIMGTAETRGYIFNWLGRRCHFPDPKWAYRGPNYLVAGGCADVVKVAMNRIDEYLWGRRSRLVMTVHDELPTEVHESEISDVPGKVKEFMETAFESKYLPLTCGMEWSEKSLGDKRKGFPV